MAARNGLDPCHGSWHLLDASEGAPGRGAQLQELAATLRADRVLIVDGGDRP
jgi:hypothetical protein